MIHNLFHDKRVLVVAAHNDDIEFMAGGLLHLYREEIAAGYIRLGVVTLASREQNTGESFAETLVDQSTAFETLGIVPEKVENHQFRSRFLPDHDDEIRILLRETRIAFDPDVIITHYCKDPNQDHQSVCQQVLRVFSNRTILAGEISNTGIHFDPQVFVGLKEENVAAKCRAVQSYRAERDKYYFADELLFSLARVRGAQSGCFTYAEAYELYRMQAGTTPER